MKQATGAGNRFALRHIHIDMRDIFLQEEGVYLLTGRFYEVSSTHTAQPPARFS